MRSYDAITKISLKKEKSASGIAYSRAVFAFVGKLNDKQKAEAAAMAETINATDKSIDIDDGDYSTGTSTASSAGDGFMNVQDGIDENLPFN